MKLLSVIAVAAACVVGLGASVSVTSSRLFTEASAKGKKKGPGECGTYNYWKAGKCVDARMTPVKK